MKITPYKFEVGEKVIFINPNGVNWGEKIISERGKISYSRTSDNGYKYVVNDTPWFFSAEENFYKLTDTKLIAQKTKIRAYHNEVEKRL